MRFRGLTILTCFIFLLSNLPTSSAAVKAGDKCSKLNSTKVVSKTTLKCEKVKGKLVWVIKKSAVKNTNTNQNTASEMQTQVWQMQTNSIVQESSLTTQLYSPEKTIKIDGVYRSYFVSKVDGSLVFNESLDGVTYTRTVKTNLKRSRDITTDTSLLDHPVVLKLKNGKFLMIHDICVGTCDVGPGLPRRLVSRTSDDGIQWGAGVLIPGPNKSGLNPEGKIFDSVPTAIQLSSGDIRVYYVQGGAAIGSAISKDNGTSWTVEDGFRLGTPYSNTPQRESFIDPGVIQDSDGTVYLYFGYVTDWSCMENGGTPKGCVPLRVARSSDGLNFKVDSGNVIEPGPGATQIGDPDVFIGPDGKWLVLYASVSNNNMQFTSVLTWAIRTK